MAQSKFLKAYDIEIPVVLKCTVFASDRIQAKQEAVREARCFLAYARAHEWDAVREDHDGPAALVGELVRGWAATG